MKYTRKFNPYEIKIIPVQGMKTYQEVEVWFHIFLT